MNSTWLWGMIFFMCCWVHLAKILLRIFASIFIKDIGLSFSFSACISLVCDPFRDNRVVASLTLASAPLPLRLKLVQGFAVGFLMGGADACPLVGRADSYTPLVCVALSLVEIRGGFVPGESLGT